MIKAYLAKGMDKRAFVEKALFDYCGKSGFVFARRPTGKPYAVDGPCFSFSDSRGYMLCAVSDYEIGADLEMKRVAAGYMGVVKRFFAPDEAAAATEDNFFDIYTAKEAYVKFAEMGIFSGMERFSTLGGRVGSVNIIHFSDGCCVCAAASERESEVEIKWLCL